MPPQDPETARWFATELEPHEDSLRAYLHRQFPAYPEIDDLVQETYARLLRARETGPLHAPKAFLFTTARDRPQLFEPPR
ncbi:MAG: hypothetical protein FJ284_15145, partial [Planctomycetes bacterium]|nr:hypothetical protein [Planctomycetota bacterium]